MKTSIFQNVSSFSSLDPSNRNITKSSQLLLISHGVFNGGLMGRPDLFTGSGIFAGSPYWALISL
jgi:hypothetical protein